MKAPTELPLVLVEWDDACHFDSGATMRDVLASHRPERVTTLGWKMVDDEVGIMLASEFYDDMYRGRTLIPRAMIVKVTNVKLTKESTRGRQNIQRPSTEDIAGQPQGK